MSIEGTRSSGDPAPTSEPDSSADADKLAAYLEGSAATFREVDDWVRGEIASRYPVLRPEIEDVAQAVHAKLVSNFREGRFLGLSSLRTYVASVAHYTAVDRIRSLYRDRAVFAQDPVYQDPPAQDNPYRSLQRLENGRLLSEAVRRSPAACRDLWRMVMLEKLSYDAIAKRLAIPSCTVKSRMWYCRKKVMSFLSRARGRREEAP
jgi:RNA polymerase sigma factor (sigma-70 family)